MTTGQKLNTADIRHSERRERKRLEALWWAAALIWAGLVFGADGMGLVPQIGNADDWSWVFLGVGLIAVLGSLYRVTSSNVPKPTTWDWGWGSFCLIIGLGGFTTVDIAWPLILILIGGVVLVSALWRRD